MLQPYRGTAHLTIDHASLSRRSTKSQGVVGGGGVKKHHHRLAGRPAGVLSRFCYTSINISTPPKKSHTYVLRTRAFLFLLHDVKSRGSFTPKSSKKTQFFLFRNRTRKNVIRRPWA